MAEETISRHPSGASWITDKDGNPVQHLQYLPYGEPYINQRTTGYNERFTFTGKERDEEGQNFISNYYIISRNQGLSQYYMENIGSPSKIILLLVCYPTEYANRHEKNTIVIVHHILSHGKLYFYKRRCIDGHWPDDHRL